ncbi:MAG: class I SAM-dependent DNA methyltransferase, partial [Candidatus Hodarchaeota archaeon]
MMKAFLEYLKSEKIIDHLLNSYLKDYDIDLIDNRLKFIVKKLKSFEISKGFDIKFDENHSDVFGTFYEKQLNHIDKKHRGEFYTPIKVVDYILEAIGCNYDKEIENKKIIDISCGSGSFLIRMVGILIDHYKEKYQKEELNRFTSEEAKEVIRAVKSTIFGVDINPVACILCQINLHYTLFGFYKIVKNRKATFVMPRFNIFNFNSILLVNPKFSHKLKNIDFDYVIGNPPYLFIRDIPKDHRILIEKSECTTNDGQYDYYQIFIEVGIRLLKNHGLLGYIVPDSLLALSNREIIRKYIYITSKVQEICFVGPQFDDPVVSNIILIVQKENSKHNRESNEVLVKFPNRDNTRNNRFMQKKIQDWNYQFLINLNEKDIDLLEFLNDKFEKLEDLNKIKGFNVVLNRGVEIGKKGEIFFCSRCKQYYPLPKNKYVCPTCKNELNQNTIESIICDDISGKSKEDYKLFVYSISRYRIKKYKYINIRKDGIKYKDFKFYSDRIILRQLSQNSLICATYDNKLSLTSQSFYNLKIEESPISELN